MERWVSTICTYVHKIHMRISIYSVHVQVQNNTHTPTHTHTHTHTHTPHTHAQDVFYQMEVGGSDYYPEGEQEVMYFKKPGVGQGWRKLSDIAARVSHFSCPYAAWL